MIHRSSSNNNYASFRFVSRVRSVCEQHYEDSKQKWMSEYKETLEQGKLKTVSEYEEKLNTAR